MSANVTYLLNSSLYNHFAEALSLTVFAAMYPEAVKGFRIFGVVKETGVDDEGLAEFYQKYFSYPLYRDNTYAFYQALGDRKVGMGAILNPISLFGILCDAFNRIRSKQISGNFKGEGIVQGGIIVFDKDGKPACVYEEETGVDLRVAELAAALETVRAIEDSETQLEDSSTSCQRGK